MIVEVTTYHLEMTDPEKLCPKQVDWPQLTVERGQKPSPELNRFMYAAVGGDWNWIDRLSWTYHRWQEWVHRPELETWVGFIDGNPAGYFELESQPNANVEIASFGLLPSVIGQGLGGHLLTVAVNQAWQMGAKRVWLHTCSLDHPSALPNYQARGFRVFQESTASQVIPEQSPGPGDMEDV